MTAFFISYRRKDTAPTAGRLYDRLRNEFGKENLFMDVDTISAGMDFVDAIEQAIKKADVLLVLLGDKWLSGDNSGATNLLQDPDDYVRKEITAALSNHKHIVPLLIDGAEMPTAVLPDELKPFGQCHALKLSNSQFDSDFDSLRVKLIEATDIVGVPGARRRVCSACTSRVPQDAIKCPSCGNYREDVELLRNLWMFFIGIGLSITAFNLISALANIISTFYCVILGLVSLLFLGIALVFSFRLNKLQKGHYGFISKKTTKVQ